MLVPAIIYKDELERKFKKEIYTERYFYYVGYAYGFELPKIEVRDNYYQWAIIDENAYEEDIPKLPEFAENVGRVIADCFKQYCKIAHETLDIIKTMPDDEFEQFCQQLDSQQTALARRIRMKGCDANEQEKTNT